MTPTEARFMADLLETRRYRYQPTEDVRTSEEEVALALRSLADQVETLQKSESVISASERERCAAFVDSLGHEYDCPDLGKIAAAIRDLGDD